jgi:hypothetical protein
MPLESMVGAFPTTRTRRRTSDFTDRRFHGEPRMPSTRWLNDMTFIIFDASRTQGPLRLCTSSTTKLEISHAHRQRPHHQGRRHR